MKNRIILISCVLLCIGAFLLIADAAPLLRHAESARYLIFEKAGGPGTQTMPGSAPEQARWPWFPNGSSSLLSFIFDKDSGLAHTRDDSVATNHQTQSSTLFTFTPTTYSASIGRPAATAQVTDTTTYTTVIPYIGIPGTLSGTLTQPNERSFSADVESVSLTVIGGHFSGDGYVGNTRVASALFVTGIPGICGHNGDVTSPVDVSNQATISGKTVSFTLKTVGSARCADSNFDVTDSGWRDVTIRWTVTFKQPTITTVTREINYPLVAGTNVGNKFDVAVDWHGAQPGTVTFYVNGSLSAVVAANQSGASNTFNMASDFPAQVTPSTVTVIATSSTGQTSQPYQVNNIRVYPWPSFLPSFIFNRNNGNLEYTFTKKYPDPPFSAEVDTSDWPLPGGLIGIEPTQTQMSAKLVVGPNSRTGSFTFSGGTGLAAPVGLSDVFIKGKVTGGGNFELRDGVGLYLNSSTTDVNLSIGVRRELKPSKIIPQLKSLNSLPYIGGCFQKFNDDSKISYSASGEGQIHFSEKAGPWNSLNPDDSTGTFGPKVEASLQTKLCSRFTAKFWISGALNFQVGFLQPNLRDVTLNLQAGADLELDFLFKINKNFKFNTTCKWSSRQCSVSTTDTAIKTDTPDQGSGQITLIKKDYKSYGEYSRFEQSGKIATGTASKGGALAADLLFIKSRSGTAGTTDSSSTTRDAAIVANIFPGSSPVMRDVGGGKLLLWVHQDPSLPVTQSTDISWSFFDGTAWSVPALIKHDTQAELSPVLGVDQSGRAVAAWLRIKDPSFTNQITTAADLPLFYNQLEVVSSIFDPSTRTWGPITQLTDNNSFETSLNLVSDGVGHLLLTWLSNQGGEFLSTPASPSTLQYSFWNGTGWASPQVAAAGLAGVATHTAAISGSDAFIVLGRDPDPTMPVDGLIELYRWVNGSWAHTIFAGGGGMDNRSPMAAYDSAGVGHLMWVKGDDLVHATLSNPTPQVIRTNSATASFYNAKLLTNGQGNLTVIWQDVAQQGLANIFAIFYDPTSGLWSSDRQLNDSSWVSRDAFSYYGSDNRLRIAYLATEQINISETVMIGGVPTTITNIPTDGSTSLRVIDHPILTDLSVTDADLSVTPEKLDAGTAGTANIVLKNAGDLPINNFSVTLYAGSPTGSKMALSTMRVTQSIRGGETKELAFTFNYPTQGGDIFAVVDSAAEVAESDETNNTADFFVQPASVDTTNTISATADAYVKGGTDAGKNFGAQPEIQLRSSEIERRGYLKFDISQVPDGRIGSIRLRLFGRLYPDQGPSGLNRNVPVILQGVEDASWNESAITWNNQPQSTGSVLGRIVVQDSVERWYEFVSNESNPTLLNYIREQKALRKNYVSLRLTNGLASDGGASLEPEPGDYYTNFHSKEAVNNGPQLIIGTGPVDPSKRDGLADPIACSKISGWAWDSTQPDAPIRVTVEISKADKTVVYRQTVAANLFRQDIFNQHKGDGRHGYEVTFPDGLKDNYPYTIVVFYETGTDLVPQSLAQSLLFAGCRPPVFIRGRVTSEADGSGIGGVSLRLVPGTFETVNQHLPINETVTSTDGSYVLKVSDPGGDYAVTPASLQYYISPLGVTFPAISTDRVANFTAHQRVCSDAPSGVISWWRAEGSAEDVFGAALGRLSNGASYASGVAGQAFKFDGVDDKFEAPLAAMFPTGNSPRTIETWVNVDPAMANNSAILFSYGATSNELFEISTQGLSDAGRVRLAVKAGGTSMVSDTGVPPGTFMHIAVTYNGSGLLRVYINGSLRNNTTLTGALNTGRSATLRMGTGATEASHFAGLIDETSVFGRELTTQEVSNIYEAGIAGKCNPYAQGALDRSFGSNGTVTTSVALLLRPLAGVLMEHVLFYSSLTRRLLLLERGETMLAITSSSRGIAVWGCPTFLLVYLAK